MDQTADDLPLLLTVEQTSRKLHIGRSRVFELIATGELRSLSIGRSRRIPTAECERFITARMEAEALQRPA